jgi:hypothetical protein
MVSSWGLWKPFPNHASGGNIEAPIGPGVYEVRHADTGELIAFGSAGSVARELSKLMPKPATGLRSLFAGKTPAHRSEDLEYRTCSACKYRGSQIRRAAPDRPARSLLAQTHGAGLGLISFRFV